MILMNNNKHKNLNQKTKNQIIELLEIYMPNIKLKILNPPKIDKEINNFDKSNNE